MASLPGTVLHKGGNPVLGAAAMACTTCSKWTLIRYFKITSSSSFPFFVFFLSSPFLFITLLFGLEISLSTAALWCVQLPVKHVNLEAH